MAADPRSIWMRPVRGKALSSFELLALLLDLVDDLDSSRNPVVIVDRAPTVLAGPSLAESIESVPALAVFTPDMGSVVLDPAWPRPR